MQENKNKNIYQSPFNEKFKNLYEIYQKLKLTNSCQDAIISIKKYSMNREKTTKHSPVRSKENKYYQYKCKSKLLRSTHQPHVDASLNNISNLSIKNSNKKSSNQLINEAQELRKQNQLLKEQVKYLKSCLSFDQPMFQTEDNFLTKITKLQAEKSNLKKIIEKSYYSLKDLEKQNDKLTSELTFLREKSTQTTSQLFAQQQKLAYFEAQNYNLRNTTQYTKKQHLNEMHFLHERIQNLERVLDDMNRHLEIDNRQWKKKQNQFQSIKQNYK